jgi:hypothetical protein
MIGIQDQRHPIQAQHHLLKDWLQKFCIRSASTQTWKESRYLEFHRKRPFVPSWIFLGGDRFTAATQEMPVATAPSHTA